MHARKKAILYYTDCMQRVMCLILLVLSLSCTRQERSRVAICAMFKNEAPWLKEWIDYHRIVLGIDHFYLYNNDSTDHYKEVLRSLIDEGFVELIDWSSSDPKHELSGAFMDAPWSGAQLGAYNDCLKNRALGKMTWVAMIDVDEFIVPTSGVDSFYELLRKAEKKNKATVCLSWRVFGTSNVEDLKQGELLTERLTWRSSDEYGWNRHVKSLHRPEYVSFALVHIAESLSPNFGSKTLSADDVRLHHYWTRTERFCSERRKQSKEIDPQFFDNLHKIEDKTILQYLPALKKQECHR